MPVQKFRSFEDAEDALWGRSGDPAHLKRVAWVWAFSQKLRPMRARPGVRRFRSFEDAQRDAER